MAPGHLGTVQDDNVSNVVRFGSGIEPASVTSVSERRSGVGPEKFHFKFPGAAVPPP